MIFFGIITHQAIRRGTFGSVREGLTRSAMSAAGQPPRPNHVLKGTNGSGLLRNFGESCRARGWHLAVRRSPSGVVSLFVPPGVEGRRPVVRSKMRYEGEE